MSKTQTQKPILTANGIEKGRPGKGRVLSLGQRANCYATPKHAMTEENTFRYTAKRVTGKPKPIERQWCKKCRAISRKGSHDRRVAEAKTEAARQQREVKAQLAHALPKARKAAKPKATAKATAKRAKGVKVKAKATARKATAKAKANSRKRAA